MLPYFPFLEAAYMAKMTGGGTAVEKYDRISGLPTVFAFDMADGWRCELCADSNPTDCPKTINTRYDSWSTEYQSTVICTQINKSYHLRIFSGSDLKLATDLFNDNCTKWYSSNGDTVGELKKTITSIHSDSDFGISSVSGYNTDKLDLPYVYLGYTLTQTINETTTTNSGVYGIIGSNMKFISKGDLDVNVYADFVKAVRKFSDEFNGTSSTT